MFSKRKELFIIKTTTLLIDGNSVAYTINIAECKNEKDFVHKFMFRLREYGKQFTSLPKAILFFDDKFGGNWRENLYPDYQKGRREAKLKYTQVQIEESKKRSEYLHYLKSQIDDSKYMYLHYPKTETDDLIALYCNNVQKENETVVILTTDKDLFQLIRENGNRKVQILFLIKRKLIKEEKLGKQILEDKIWLGDNSDSIPGVCKNVGKTTIEDLKKFLHSTEDYMYKTGENLDIHDVKKMKNLCCDTLNIKYIPSFSNFSQEQLDLNRKLIDLSYVVEQDENQNNIKTNYLKEVVDKAKFSPFAFYNLQLK